ncbi:unnamed protein product [Notodromas monacha]|uniref:Ig-like domain-containing protein n=1 Tax=Notodromas monacha TaxID=399045 RepID=A0A7R9BLT9_9CRUS|nr:unnamed protein product [Notodromas monacha]CAG0917581.1 unnamed protein product [Notodromas monacha]
MGAESFALVAAAALVLVVAAEVVSGCPPPCDCPVPGHQSGRVSCDGSALTNREAWAIEKIVSLVPVDVRELNITGFSFVRIPTGVFQSFRGLKGLSVKNSGVKEVASAAFLGLAELRSLDLSGNDLLSLGLNTFHSLDRLQNVDLSKNPLVCGCDIKWLWEWSQNSKTVTATCTDGRTLNSRVEFDGCPRSKRVADLLMHPVGKQLMFAGDSVTLTCSAVAQKPDSLNVFWVKGGAPVNSSFPGVTLLRPELRRVDIEISVLSAVHDGDWTCVANSSLEIETKELQLRVISEHTAYCPDTITEGNRGRFTWPKSLEGTKVLLSCGSGDEFSAKAPSGTSPKSASDRNPVVAHHCRSRGVWDELDESACPFVSVSTKILQQFSETSIRNMPNEDSALKSANLLKNYTANTTVIRDPIDIVFIARTLDNYVEYAPEIAKHTRELAGELVEIASVIQGLQNEALLREAQFSPLYGRTLTRIVSCLEKIPQHIRDFYHGGTRISISAQPVEAASFAGLHCKWVKKDINHREITCKHLQMLEGESSSMPWPDVTMDDEDVLASIAIPGDILSPGALGKQLIGLTWNEWTNRHQGREKRFTGRRGDSRNQQRFDFFAFESYSLFLDDNENRVIAGPVFGCKTSPFPSLEPDPKISVDVSIRLPFDIPASVARDVVALHDQDVDGRLPPPILAGAMWNESTARWDVGGRHCSVVSINDAVVLLSCHRCGYYGVSVERKFFLRLKPGAAGFQKLPHPLIFVGSVICVGCLLVGIGVLWLEQRRISWPSLMRHTLANSWVSIALLVSLYCGGIFQTGNAKACQGIGLLLHFLVQASVMWMINSLSYLHSKVKLPYHSVPGSEAEEDPPANVGSLDPPLGDKATLDFAVSDDDAGKQVLQTYLLGYGVPFLLCAVSASVNIREYGGLYVCTLPWRPAAWAVLAPLGIAAVAALVLCLCVACTLQCSLVTGADADDGGVDGGGSGVGEQQAMLNSHVAALLMFAAVVVFAALAVASAEEEVRSAADVAYAALYCAACTLLGVFVFLRFVLLKIDFSGSKAAVAVVPIAPVVAEPEPTPVMVSGSVTSAPAAQTRSHASGGESFAPVVLPPAVVVAQPPVPVVNRVFYDPQQMSVAKRFFEKQRRKQLRAAVVGNPAESWGDGSEAVYAGGDGDETSSHFTSVSNQRPNVGQRMCKWSGFYQQERVVIGQECIGAVAAASAVGAGTPGIDITSGGDAHSDVLLPDVDSEDGLSLMRPTHQATSPSRSIVSDATCATYNSSNVAALRIRGLRDVGAHEGTTALSPPPLREPASASTSSCSTGSCRNKKRETCI